MQISAATTQKGQAFEGKGVGAHKFKPHCFSPNAVPFSPNSKQPVIPFAKPSLKGLTGQAPINKTPQFPPTPSTIIKPPRFYSNQSLIIPRSKPNLGNVVNVVSDSDKECICEREDGIVICQRCGSELLGRVQQKCAAHPRKIPLMDHRECLNSECRSIKLAEISMNEDDFL